MTRAERIAAFPIGCRVQLSPVGRSHGPTKAFTGTVVGHSYRHDAIVVKRDGRKATLLSWHGYWERADAEPHIEEHW